MGVSGEMGHEWVRRACVEVSKEPTAGHADDPDLQRTIVGTNERDS